MKNLLITGKNGFIGLSIKKYLSSDYFNINFLDMRDPVWKNTSFIGIDAIIHAAGITHSKPKKNEKDLYYKVNTQMTCELAHKAKVEGVRHFIYLSSMLVYGHEGKMFKDYSIDATTIPNPKNFYGNSKLKAEECITSLVSENFFVSILRLPLVHGENSKGNYQKLINLIKKTPIFPMIKNKRSVLHIKNLVSFIDKILKNDIFGVLFPQDKILFNPSLLYQQTRNRKCSRLLGYLLFFFQWIPSIRKIFGNKYYKQEISDIGIDYNIVNETELFTE